MRKESQSTVVVNSHNSAYDVLIDRTTIFGNPFSEWKWGREKCIALFEEYFYKRINRDPAWKAEVLKLKGKILGCHCSPLLCHGAVYADYLNSYDEVENLRVIAALEGILERINYLAADEGWYEPELQGEARDLIAQVDDLACRAIADMISDETDEAPDYIAAINKYLEMRKANV